MSTGDYSGRGGPSGPRAGLWRRLAAVFIDGLLLGIATGILYALLKSGGYAIGILVALGYYSYFEGTPAGQTLGKRALAIRLIDSTLASRSATRAPPSATSRASCRRSSSTSVICGCSGTGRSSAGTTSSRAPWSCRSPRTRSANPREIS